MDVTQPYLSLTRRLPGGPLRTPLATAPLPSPVSRLSFPARMLVGLKVLPLLEMPEPTF